MSNSIDDLWQDLRSGRPYFIAEAGVNHLGSLEMGERLIREAAQAGAQAIKFQSYKAKNLCIADAPRFWDWEGEEDPSGSQIDSYSLLDSFGEDEHRELYNLCQKYGIEFMSTPFDNEATDYLDRIGTRAYKIASCDLTNFPLLEHVARKNKIMMLSTGAADLKEIDEAVELIAQHTDKIVIMHCNLKYPTANGEINLDMINSIREFFIEKYGDKFVFGLSDHTMNVHTPSFACIMGANVVEKHYTVDKTLKLSADHWLSVDPEEVTKITELMNLAHTMKGSNIKTSTESEERARLYARRSIVSLGKISSGEILSVENIACKRPGTGLSPKLFNSIIGKRAVRDISADTLLCIEDFE